MTKRLACVAMGVLLSSLPAWTQVQAPAEASARAPVIAPASQPAGKDVPPDVMQRVFEEARTPHKYGIVIRGLEGRPVDCPHVFRHKARWYMLYICMNKVGYETHLAASDDLLTWKTLGPILTFRKSGWDAWQAAAGAALQEAAWGGSYELGTHGGKYWLSYVGGALRGYETDPLSIGMAWTDAPSKPAEWTRIAQNPVLGPNQADARDFEKLTLYKSHILHVRDNATGFPYVMFYNAKTVSGYERIGMAVSKDMVSWQRYGKQAVIDNGKGISGDPQVVRMGDVWVMFYFGAFWKPKAFDTFACSYDLVHWRKWTGPHLVEPSEPWDAQYAHKPFLVKHGDVVYHYYCAVGDQGRVIALATSRDLNTPRPPGPGRSPRESCSDLPTPNQGTKGLNRYGIP